MRHVQALRQRRTAATLVGHGWAVLAGASWQRGGRRGGHGQGRFSCGPDCTIAELHPVTADGTCMPMGDFAAAAASSTEEIARRWSPSGPARSLLVATGQGCDVLEVPWALLWGQGTTADAMRSAPSAVWRDPSVGRGAPGHMALLFVEAGTAQEVAYDATSAGIVVHEQGSWVPVPPSTLAAGLAWHRHPSVTGWQLPHAGAVLDIALTPRALRAGGRTCPVTVTSTATVGADVLELPVRPTSSWDDGQARSA